jgi:hypothetical protein
MPIDETKLHDLPGASASRGPPWLVTAGPQARWPSTAGSARHTASYAS